MKLLLFILGYPKLKIKEFFRMLTIKELQVPGYEKVIEAHCDETRMHAFIAIHDTRLGPALGGTRFYPYALPEEALNDVLRLSKAMSYKSAIIQDGLGGGKSVIIGDPMRDKSEALLSSFAQVLNRLQGRYIAAEDLGTSVEDMLAISKTSPYVAGLPTENSCGDPSRFTAHGVFRGLQAVAMTLWGNPSLKGKKILIQGLGNVGMKVAELLFWEKADLIVAEVDPLRADKAEHDMGAQVIGPEAVSTYPCDIFAPCALGGILNAKTVNKLKCLAVAGGANNQLETPEQGVELFERGILYAPDIITNAGGIIAAATEFEPEGFSPKKARNDTDKIYDTLIALFETSKREKKPTHIVADEMAEYNLNHGIGKRVLPIQFEMPL